jgi:hypothetical protein
MEYKLRIVVEGSTVIEHGPFSAQTEEEVAAHVRSVAKEGVFQETHYYPPHAIRKIVIAEHEE